jgi:hypothetical protein
MFPRRVKRFHVQCCILMGYQTLLQRVYILPTRRYHFPFVSTRHRPHIHMQMSSYTLLPWPLPLILSLLITIQRAIALLDHSSPDKSTAVDKPASGLDPAIQSTLPSIVYSLGRWVLLSIRSRHRRRGSVRLESDRILARIGCHQRQASRERDELPTPWLDCLCESWLSKAERRLLNSRGQDWSRDVWRDLLLYRLLLRWRVLRLLELLETLLLELLEKQRPRLR